LQDWLILSQLEMLFYSKIASEYFLNLISPFSTAIKKVFQQDLLVLTPAKFLSIRRFNEIF
jgi:hypothetical protein